MRNRTWCGALLSAAALAAVVSATPVAAQTPYIPYFGKNQVRYDNFQWMTYETEHFVIYFYPEIRPHLERMAGYAESAYQAISSDLKHDLAEKVPLILFQTEQRVPAAERDSWRSAGRRRRVRRADPQAHRDADGRAAGPALPADGPRADAPVRVRHHPHLADAAQRAAVGQRGPVGLHDRHLAPDRPDDGARRRHRRQRAEDVGDGRLRQLRQPAHGLQPGPRGVRVHRVAVGQGRLAAVPVRAAQVGHRRRRERVPGSVQDRAGGVRPAVRQVPEGSVQAVPRQGAPGRLRPQPGAEPREDVVQQRADRRTVALGRSASPS